MPRSSRHKSHKQSKHSSKDYSDSEEDVIRMKEKSSKDEPVARVHRDSASGEKRKISSHVREDKDSKDMGGHRNGGVLEEYVSSKRRKDKLDGGGSDRWSGGGDETGDSDRNLEKEMHKGESSKVDSKSKENSRKSESLRIESKNKNKRHESGSTGERKEDSLASVVMDKEESKSKGESKRKSDRDSSARKEGKESKDKDRRSDKEKSGVHESTSGDVEVKLKLVDMDFVKKQGSKSGDFSEERQGKRARENSEHTVRDESRNPEMEKEVEKRIRRRREGSSENDKSYYDSKDDDESQLSSRADRAKDVKYRDDKHKSRSYSDKYQEDGNNDDKGRNQKCLDKVDKNNKHEGDKYRDDRHLEDGEREKRRKDEKHDEAGERDSRGEYEKYREAMQRDGRRNDKYQDHEEDDKDSRRGDERYYEDGDTNDRHKDYDYRDGGNRDSRDKEEKYREDLKRDIRHKDGKRGDDFYREKRPRDTKYRDEHASRDRSGEKSDPRRTRDHGYAADHYSRKSTAFDDSPSHDDRTARYRDDQGRRRADEKDDYGDTRSRGTRDKKSDAEMKTASSARKDLVAERLRPTSRDGDSEIFPSYSRRRSSPTSSFHAPRDDYRVLKEDGHLGEPSAERRFKSDIRSSPSSTGRRELSRPDMRRSIDVEDSTPRSGGSRDVRQYSGKEGRGSRELGMDVPPGDELLQADADTLSVSSPYMRNSQFSSNTKLFQPPPAFRTGVESPLPFGSAEDDGRGKSNIRHRKIGDPSMGRIAGHAWRGAPSWPSPAGNGFLPFPHAPPPISFPVMQPFAAPPMFGVRPSMELNHPAPYQMPDADRFPGPGRPMGWRNQVDGSFPPLHGWDTSIVFGDESHIYGRSDWDNSRNLPAGRGWETSGDLLKGPNRTASLEMPSSEKENNATRTADEASADRSIQPAENEQAHANQQTECTDITRSTKDSEKNDIEAPVMSLGENNPKISRKDDVPPWLVYLSKLDISADLAEPELFNKCAGLTDVDQNIYTDIDEAKILLVEEAVEARMASYKPSTCTLFASTDVSVFQKSMSLYKRLKKRIWSEDGEKLRVFSEFTPNPGQEDQNVDDDKTKKLYPTDDMQDAEEALPNFDVEENPMDSVQIDLPVATNIGQRTEEPVSDLPVATNIGQRPEEPVSASGHVNVGVSAVQENDFVEKPLSPLPPSKVKDVSVEDAGNNEEGALVDSRCGSLVSCDVSSEAIMMPESIVSGSVNLSRIHHSPESTH